MEQELWSRIAAQIESDEARLNPDEKKSKSKHWSFTIKLILSTSSFILALSTFVLFLTLFLKPQPTIPIETCAGCISKIPEGFTCPKDTTCIVIKDPQYEAQTALFTVANTTSVIAAFGSCLVFFSTLILAWRKERREHAQENRAQTIHDLDMQQRELDIKQRAIILEEVEIEQNQSLTEKQIKILKAGLKGRQDALTKEQKTVEKKRKQKPEN